MSEGKYYICDGPGCEQTSSGKGQWGIVPDYWYNLDQQIPGVGRDARLHFCSLPCLRTWAEQHQETREATA